VQLAEGFAYNDFPQQQRVSCETGHDLQSESAIASDDSGEFPLDGSGRSAIATNDIPLMRSPVP